MKRILLIGPGKFGLRHLQSLIGLNLALSITILGRRDTLPKEFQDIVAVSQKSVEYCSNFSQLRNKFDLAIVSTCSDVRYEISRAVVEELGVNRLILEKVLFNNLEHYSKFLKVVRQANASVWVNTKRRTMSAYSIVKDCFRNDRIEHIYFSGRGMGVATNAMHIIDTAEFLTDAELRQMDGSFLGKVVPSKRIPFLDVQGSLTALLNNDTRVTIRDDDAVDVEKTMRIESCNNTIVIDENANGFIWNNVYVDLIFEKQSELTRNVRDILQNGSCMLPTIEVSTRQHLMLFNTILLHFQRSGAVRPETQICPIT